MSWRLVENAVMKRVKKECYTKKEVDALVERLASQIGEPPSNTSFYVPPTTARTEAQKLRAQGRLADADDIAWLAQHPQGLWFNSYGDLGKVAAACTAARAAEQAIILVPYVVPGRDNGGHSRGGAVDTDHYLDVIDALCVAVGDTSAYVVLEPDAVNLPDFLDEDRIAALNGAMERLARLKNAKGYIDAGHSNWRPAQDVRARLSQLTIPDSFGISVNVSSSQPTGHALAWAKTVTNRQIVIDTSRNGADVVNNEWCNIAGAKAGTPSTTSTGDPQCDALLWVKPPGESDGECNGGPPAGQWFESWALDFARRSRA